MTVEKREASVARRRDAAEAIARRVERHVPIVGRVAVPAGGVRLPDLDDRVRHGITGAVAERALDDDLHVRRAAAVATTSPVSSSRPKSKKGPTV